MTLKQIANKRQSKKIEVSRLIKKTTLIKTTKQDLEERFKKQ